MTCPNLLDLSPDEINSLCLALGEKSYCGKQVSSWVFKHGVNSFDQMSDISKNTRQKLAQASILYFPQIKEIAEDDSARKILWQLHDGEFVESVLIKEKNHFTLCLSSQVGCALGCRFCRTGTLGFIRNLSSGEILAQIIEAKKLLNETEKLTNLVFMGMGEPLLNSDNVLKSLAIISDLDYLAIGKRHISLSTVGIVPQMQKLLQGPDIGLTISLSAADNDLRNDIMPINKKYPLEELKKTLLDWPLARGRRITIAYVLLNGVNDQTKDALKLSRFLNGLKAKINLIPFNPWPGAPFEAPTSAIVENFRETLVSKNHTVIVRWSKGGKVSAACGQLAGKTINS